MVFESFDLKNLEEKYELELERIVGEIKKINKKNARVLLQLPDGLKPYSLGIVDYLQDKVGTDVFISIYLGDCFGACDIPSSDCDLLVQFGHAPWKWIYDLDKIGYIC